MKPSKNTNTNLLNFTRELVEKKSKERSDNIEIYIVDSTFLLRSRRFPNMAFPSVPLEAAVALVKYEHGGESWVDEYYVVGVRGTDKTIKIKRMSSGLLYTRDLKEYFALQQRDILEALQYNCDDCYSRFRRLSSTG